MSHHAPDMSHGAVTSWHRLEGLGSGILALLVVAIALYGPAIVLSGAYAWDDGAITVAFARTLAEAGIFALTPESPVSEGSSSLLFMGVLAALWSVLTPDFDGGLALAKLVSFFFLTINAVTLFVLGARTRLGRAAAFIVSALYLMIGMNMAEVMNGMEMTVFGTLLLAFVLAYQAGSALSFALVPLLLLCRFEAVFYLGFAFVFLALFATDPAARRRALSHAVAVGAAFAAITAWRLVVFGTYLPTTVWAKMNPPYSVDGLADLTRKVGGVYEFISINAVLLVAAALIIAALGTRRSEVQRIEGWLVLSFLAFAAISGKNWGYDGRMFLGLLPVLIHWLIRLTDALLCAQYRATGARLAPWPFVAVPVLVLAISNLEQMRSNLMLLANARQTESARASGIDGEIAHRAAGHGVTPENYRITGEAVTALMDILQVEQPVFLVPDVGGLGLCCPGLRVIDLALLTNPRLARAGYGGLAAQLEAERPDLIQTHGIWSANSRIFEIDLVQTTYAPVVFRNTLFLMRQDLLDRAPEVGLAVTRAPAAEALENVRYATSNWNIRNLRRLAASSDEASGHSVTLIRETERGG